ncbi:MAG: AraC family transcriptional regulator [Gammaproteobacteria bacterium]
MKKPETLNTASLDAHSGGTVRVAPLMPIPTLLREHGCDPEPVFRHAGLPIELWEHPETEVSFIAASRLLEESVAASGCDHLGLLIGERVQLSSLGLAGLMLCYATNAKEAIDVLTKHLNLHDSGGLVTFDITGQSVKFGYLVREPGASAIDQIYDMSISVACKIMRKFCGAHWSPSKVALSRKQPHHSNLYTQFFHAPVEFNAAANYLEFPLSWLNFPNASADPQLFRYLSERAGEQQARRDSSLLTNLQRMMLNAIFHRNCSVEHVARQLGMHQRTLNRKLGKLDTSFRKELEKMRFELSRQMLANQEISINKIASFLDYSDQAAFSRAFKAWSGISPSAWRSGTRERET